MNLDTLTLRKSIESDLDTFFEHQLDPDWNQMAAFTAEKPTDREAYFSKWKGIVANDKVNMQTILVDDLIVGSVLHFSMGDEVNVSYGIGKPFWGKGIASKAMEAFIAQVGQRPLYGRVAFDNLRSKRILEKCGFQQIGTETGFANGRGSEIEELIFRLD